MIVKNTFRMTKGSQSKGVCLGLQRTCNICLILVNCADPFEAVASFGKCGFKQSLVCIPIFLFWLVQLFMHIHSELD